jgi:XTP/dITP diphosphohydrolase
VLPQSAFNVSEAEEPHPSFVENAIAKARHAARATGLPALADDSGLCVDASAARRACCRRASPANPSPTPATTPCCSNAWPARPTAGPASTARWPSSATPTTRSPHRLRRMARRDPRHPRGTAGFGYDPLFLVSDLEQTAAEIPPSSRTSCPTGATPSASCSTSCAPNPLTPAPARRHAPPHVRSPHHPDRPRPPPRRRGQWESRLTASPPLSLYVHFPGA